VVFHSTFFEILSRMSIAASVKKSEVPPEEIKGSGVPLVGGASG
jgi:hypothetical protein